MEHPNRPVGPYLVIAGVLGVLIVTAAGLWGWWYWQSPWYALLLALTALAAAVLFSGLGWLLLRRKQRSRATEAETTARQQQQLYQQILEANFDKAWLATVPKGRDPYDTPWYFLLSEQLADDGQLLQEMGFAQVVCEEYGQAPDVPVSLWLSDAAVLVALHTGGEPQSLGGCLQSVVKRLNQRRPRQGANGLILTQSVAALLEKPLAELELATNRQRPLMRQINQVLGLELPVYCLFTQLQQIKDFSQFFATFDHQQLEQPFGAMMPVDETLGYDPTWFQASFAALQKTLSDQIGPSLKAQLDAAYRDAAMAGPYQFALLKAELEDYFRRLFQERQYEGRPLHFRGYFFVSVAGEGAPLDPLTMLHASRLGYVELPASQAQTVQRSLFTKQLMACSILPECRLVGPNRKRQRRYGLLQLAYTGGLCLLLAMILGLLKANFDYARDLDAQARENLATFKEQMSANPPDPDELTASIFSLSELREISLVYQQTKPWYVVSWLPEPGIGGAVQQAYQQQLEAVLLIALRDYLLKDLFVYHELDDKIKTLELLNLLQILYSPQRKNVRTLVDYYVHSLQEEGEGDVVTLQRFRELLDDLMLTGAVPPVKDEPLIELVKNSASSEDLSELLYLHILQQPGYRQRVDMRSELGTSYTSVFDFEVDFSGYLVPYLFTRDGFVALMSDTHFELAESAINEFESMKRRVKGTAELSRINRKLKRRYIEDYIGYWRRFVSQLRWTQIDDWGTAQQQLAVASEPSFSPLIRLYRLVSYHTDLSAVLDSPDLADTAANIAQQRLSTRAVTTQLAPLLKEQQQTEREMAVAIAKPFITYHQLIRGDETGQSRLGLAIAQLAQTREWLRQASLSQQPGQFFLAQLADKQPDNPLYQMQAMAQRYNQQLLRELLTGSAERLNQLALQAIRQLLNKHWSQDVLGYYNRHLQPYYPFRAQAAQGVSLKHFTEFFGPRGRVVAFENGFLSEFEVQDSRYPTLPGFLPGRHLQLDYRIWQALEVSDRIRETFFAGENIGLEFAIRAQGLSAGLTEVSLRSDRFSYSYRNGPSLWIPVQWPLPGSQTDTLELRVQDGASLVNHQVHAGVWHWFRLAEALQGALLPEGGASYLVAEQDGHSAELLIRVQGDTNPFVAGFFSDLSLPKVF